MNSSRPVASSKGAAATVSLLRKFAAGGAQAPHVRERCELCKVPLAADHRHLLEMATHKIVCACDPCALRFELVLDGRFKLIPRDAFALPNLQLDDAQWEELGLPIDLAFLFYSTPARRMMALYPGPAGATESLLTLSAWDDLVAANPALGRMQPDVEALLVNRARGQRLHFLAPIDACFELVGLMRLHWRGLSGGEEVWTRIDAFFERLASRARPLTRETPHA